MLFKLLLSSIISLLILEISNPLRAQAEHKNSLINRFCIASLKSKLKLKNKKELNEISHFTCDCFLKRFKSGSSIKASKVYCQNKALEKYDL